MREPKADNVHYVRIVGVLIRLHYPCAPLTNGCQHHDETNVQPEDN